ncbi:hypothetical protein ACFL18_02830 [Patescibacteria group bacterium]
MTIAKARKILGKLGEGKSDEVIQDWIYRTKSLADLVWDSYMSLTPEEKKEFAMSASNNK